LVYEEEIWQLRTPESVVVNAGAETKKWTNLLLKHYNIWTITITTYQAATIGVIEQRQKPIPNAVPELMAYSGERKGS
jgi:hypothetical protein